MVFLSFKIKKPNMGLDISTNRKRKMPSYSEKHLLGTFSAVRANLRQIRNQFINVSKYGNGADYEWIKIEDQLVAELILKAFADDDKKKILDATVDKLRTPVEILDICKIPPTSGYRKIKSLIHDGLLILNGTHLARNERQVREYISALKNIKIDIGKGRLAVKVSFTKI